jgi:hypothetical protein
MFPGMENLSQLAQLPESMFGGRAPFSPDPEEMKRAMELAQIERKTLFKGVFVRTYDLGDPARAKQYEDDMATVIRGIGLHTHVLMSRDKQFVNASDGPRWIAHVEWLEFELKETPLTPVGTPPEEGAVNNGQNSTTNRPEGG